MPALGVEPSKGVPPSDVGRKAEAVARRGRAGFEAGPAVRGKRLWRRNPRIPGKG